MRRRSATRSRRWPRTRRDAGSWARPGVAARPRSTPGTAWPTATGACSPGRRRHAVPARVLYLHHVGALSGAEGSLRLLLRHLARDRVTPLFAGPARGAFPAALAADGVPTLPLAFAPLRRVDGVLGAVARLVRLVRTHRVDLLHANGPQTNVPAGLTGRLTGVPVIWHARNLVAGDMRDVDRALAPLATRIICNADAIRRRFVGSRGWDRSVTIVNAVDTHEFHPGVPRAPFRQELGVPDVSPLVGLVGRIGLGKGHEHFVEAALRPLRGGAPRRSRAPSARSWPTRHAGRASAPPASPAWPRNSRSSATSRARWPSTTRRWRRGGGSDTSCGRPRGAPRLRRGASE